MGFQDRARGLSQSPAYLVYIKGQLGVLGCGRFKFAFT